jgi:hypothetical protein
MTMYLKNSKVFSMIQNSLDYRSSCLGYHSDYFYVAYSIAIKILTSSLMTKVEELENY